MGVDRSAPLQVLVDGVSVVTVDLQPSVTKIAWNFAKFLVNGKGEVVQYFEPKSDLDNMRKEIEALL